MDPDELLERRFDAMGCAMQLLVVPPADGGRDLVESWFDEAVARIEDLEAKWSRFRPTSELSRLNARGRVEGLSADTYELLEDALEAWRITEARFDPTVHDALVAAGYDATIDEVRAHAPVDPAAELEVDDQARTPVPGPVGIEFDPTTRTVSLPDGVTLDLGGIGKGRTADLVADLLLAAGAPGVCVNLGGDVRVGGTPPDGGPWVVAVDDPLHADADLLVVALEEGAVATSTRTKRAWSHGGRVAHHLIDPATGRPATSGLAAVTVIARDAEWAEVLAKAAFVAGPELGPSVIADAGATGLLVADDGALLRTPGFAAFEQTRRDR